MRGFRLSQWLLVCGLALTGCRSAPKKPLAVLSPPPALTSADSYSRGSGVPAATGPQSDPLSRGSGVPATTGPQPAGLSIGAGIVTRQQHDPSRERAVNLPGLTVNDRQTTPANQHPLPFPLGSSSTGQTGTADAAWGLPSPAPVPRSPDGHNVSLPLTVNAPASATRSTAIPIKLDIPDHARPSARPGPTGSPERGPATASPGNTNTVTGLRLWPVLTDSQRVPESSGRAPIGPVMPVTVPGFADASPPEPSVLRAGGTVVPPVADGGSPRSAINLKAGGTSVSPVTVVGPPPLPSVMRMSTAELPSRSCPSGNPSLTVAVDRWLEDVDTETQWRAYQLARQTADQQARAAERDLLSRAFYRFLLGDPRN